MKENELLTEAEAVLLLDLLWEARTEAQATGGDVKILERISDKIERQIARYGLDFRDDDFDPDPAPE